MLHGDLKVERKYGLAVPERAGEENLCLCLCAPIFYPMVTLKQQLRAFLWGSGKQSKGIIAPLLTIVCIRVQVSARTIWRHY